MTLFIILLDSNCLLLVCLHHAGSALKVSLQRWTLWTQSIPRRSSPGRKQRCGGCAVNFKPRTVSTVQPSVTWYLSPSEYLLTVRLAVTDARVISSPRQITYGTTNSSPIDSLFQKYLPANTSFERTSPSKWLSRLMNDLSYVVLLSPVEYLLTTLYQLNSAPDFIIFYHVEFIIY